MISNPNSFVPINNQLQNQNYSSSVPIVTPTSIQGQTQLNPDNIANCKLLQISNPNSVNFDHINQIIKNTISSNIEYNNPSNLTLMQTSQTKNGQGFTITKSNVTKYSTQQDQNVHILNLNFFLKIIVM